MVSFRPQIEMPPPTQWHQQTINVTLCGYIVPVDVRVWSFPQLKTTATFTYMHRPYEFEMTKWSGTGQASFLLRINEYYSNHPTAPQSFGTVAADGTPTVDHNQRIAAAVRAAEDVFLTLNLILDVHGREILDYAVWYRERHPEVDTYAKLITLVTCHCIIHSDFLAGTVAYELVQFTR